MQYKFGLLFIRLKYKIRCDKDFGVKTWAYPVPVFIVAAYDKNGVPRCMNAARGGTYDTNQIMNCLADNHKTTKNIIESGAFTVSIADATIK